MLSKILEKNWIDSLSPLIDDHAYHQVRRLGDRLPADISDFWGYEIPLSTRDKAPDFLFCISSPDAVGRLLQEGPGLEPGLELLEKPIYRRLLQLSELWAGQSPLLRDVVTNLWFEFDFADLLEPIPSPNIFFAPRQGSNKLQILDAAWQVFEVLTEGKEAKEPYALLLFIMEHLNGTGWIAQIGRMLARNDEKLRLFIQDIPNQGITPFLEQIGYPHYRNERLAALLKKAYAEAKKVDLDIDLFNQIGNKIGLECYFESVSQALIFLDHLHNLGICEAEKYLDFSTHLRQISFDPEKAFQHFFSHFKVVFDPDASFSAKAYLGHVHNNLARSIIRTRPLNMQPQ